MYNVFYRFFLFYFLFIFGSLYFYTWFWLCFSFFLCSPTDLIFDYYLNVSMKKNFVCLYHFDHFITFQCLNFAFRSVWCEMWTVINICAWLGYTIQIYLNSIFYSHTKHSLSFHSLFAHLPTLKLYWIFANDWHGTRYTSHKKPIFCFIWKKKINYPRTIGFMGFIWSKNFRVFEI